MEEPLAVFEPYFGGLASTSSLSILVAAISFAILLLLIRNHRRIKRQYSQLFSMLAFFTLLISIGIGLFNYLAGERTGKVKLFQDRLETPYGTYELKEIRDMQLYVDQDRSPLTPQTVSGTHYRLLVILENDQTLSFSDSNYDTKQMIGEIRPVWKAKREGN